MKCLNSKILKITKFFNTENRILRLRAQSKTLDVDFSRPTNLTHS